MQKKTIHDFGLQPISNRFRAAHDDNEYLCNLSLVLQESTGIVTLEKNVPIEDIKSRYNWITCYEPEDHLDVVTKKLVTFLPGIEIVIGALSFKDDTLLQRLKKYGARVWRIDPESDLNLLPHELGVECVQYSFPKVNSKNIVNKYGVADLFIVRHVIEHAYDLDGFIEATMGLVSDGGYIYFEIPDCKSMIDRGSIFMLWEEHTFYFTEFTFATLLRNWGLEVVYFERFSYALEDCLCFLVKKDKNETGRGKGFLDCGKLDEEINSALTYGLKYQDNIKKEKKKLAYLANSFATLSIVGVGHLSINYLYNIVNHELFNNIVDDNFNKIGMKLPFGNQFIVGSSSMPKDDRHCCLLGFNPSNHKRYIDNISSDDHSHFASIFDI